jgi:hypothetical protein
MGCASWRAHHRQREYVELAPVGGIIRGGPKSPPTTQAAVAFGLNEVGLTDVVMATLWRFGPIAIAYAVSPGAESNHLGADIAFVHSATTRVLVYQAKIARLDGAEFRLKSEAPTDQVDMLTRSSVELNGRTFAVTGRLALYQVDLTPFLDRGDPHFWFDEWERRWHRGSLRRDFSRRPEIARRYYEQVLQYGCSPSGILAAPAHGQAPISSVAASSTWPWEFDMYEWLRSSSPLDDGFDPDAVADSPGTLADRTPEFEPYTGATREPAAGDPQETALQLATQLNLPTGRVLYLMQI